MFLQAVNMSGLFEYVLFWEDKVYYKNRKRF